MEKRVGIEEKRVGMEGKKWYEQKKEHEWKKKG